MYGEVHKLFLQGMLSRKIVKWEEAINLLRNLKTDGEPDLQMVIDEINNRVRDMKMELRSVVCEVTKNRYCVLVITIETYVASFSSSFTRNEKELFLKIMEEIITSGNGYSYLNTCINLNSNLPELMSKSNAEAAIRRFLNEKWLIQENKGLIYLGPRCISELEPIIRDMYGEYVGNCIFCERLVIMGEACRSCMCRVHSYCLERYNSGQTGKNFKCLKCENDPSDSDVSTELEI